MSSTTNAKPAPSSSLRKGKRSPSGQHSASQPVKSKRKDGTRMLRSFLKLIYWLVQLTICALWLVERWQPTYLPSVYGAPRLVVIRPLYRQGRSQISQPPRPRVLSWRRLLFLLG